MLNRFRPGLGAAAVVLAILGGCAGSGGGRAQVSEAYVVQYNKGQYAAARHTAEERMRETSGLAHDQAALIAGLSAQASGQSADARRLLEPLVTNRDTEIAGRAGAALGLLALDEGAKDYAVKMLSSAARKLSGDESARAAMHAGDAQLGLGRKDAAMAEYRSAQSSARAPGLKNEIAERIAGKRFTVQAGAFKSRANAQKKAAEARARAQPLGLTPRVVDEPQGGATVYTVQIGQFVSRQEAASARRRLGVSEWIVAAIQQ